MHRTFAQAVKFEQRFSSQCKLVTGEVVKVLKKRYNHLVDTAQHCTAV